MPYRYDPPPTTVVEALLLSNAEDLRALMNTLPVPKPRPTRKADMLKELREFLSARDDQPLPETVEGLLRNLERGERALKSRDAALLIECADEYIAASLAADRKTASLCLPAGERHVVVRAKDEKRFRKAVHGLGYGMPRA